MYSYSNILSTSGSITYPCVINVFYWKIFMISDFLFLFALLHVSNCILFLPIAIVDCFFINHDDVIKWRHFPRYWPFVRRIHRSPVNSPHKGQWRGALMFTLICARIKGWVNNREAGDLRRNRAHYDVIVMHIPGHFYYPMTLYRLQCDVP